MTVASKAYITLFIRVVAENTGPVVDQDDHREQGHDTGDRCTGDRCTGEGHDVVDRFGDPDRAGWRLRHTQSDDVPEEHPDDAEVKQRAADLQQSVLVQL